MCGSARRWRSAAGSLRVPTARQEERVGRKRTENDRKERRVERGKIDTQLDQTAGDQLGQAMMLVVVLIWSRRGVWAGGNAGIENPGNEAPNLAEDLWSLETLDSVDKESDLDQRFGGSVVVNLTRLVAMFSIVFMAVRRGCPAGLPAHMNVCVSLPSMLDPLVQRRADADGTREGKAQRHIAGDELLNGSRHRIAFSVVAGCLFFNSGSQNL